MVPSIRILAANDAPLSAAGEHVVYWMIAARRTRWSFGLDRALELATELRRPLVVLEALRAGYPWASDRLHRFVLDGMVEQEARFAAAGIAYHPYVEPRPGAGAGLLEALAARACVVVTDDFPCFFLPRMVAAAAARLPVRVERVDGNGLLPLRASDATYPSAHTFRRALQKALPRHLGEAPAPEPLGSIAPVVRGSIPSAIAARWPAADLSRPEALLASLPIDHEVPAVSYRGGERAGREALERFLSRRLSRYAEDRNNPSDDAGSGLSPYLHFGHVAAHQIVHGVLDREDWLPERLAPKAHGRKEGWWGVGASAEAFLDQLVTWRELGFVECALREGYDGYESLPEWARRTLAEHAADPRPHLYTLEQLEAAATHDEIWNAAQRQLRVEGRIHNYLRMLWGKKILEWSPSPREALRLLFALNDRHAVDGRDPSSCSGIFWTLGRYDRPWAPRRPVFGSVRYMSSASAGRKLDLEGYLSRWSERSLL